MDAKAQAALQNKFEAMAFLNSWFNIENLTERQAQLPRYGGQLRWRVNAGGTFV